VLIVNPESVDVIVKPKYLPYCCASDLYKAYPEVVIHPMVAKLLFCQGIVTPELLIQVTVLLNV
jgi:hypothetical protein